MENKTCLKPPIGNKVWSSPTRLRVPPFLTWGPGGGGTAPPVPRHPVAIEVVPADLRGIPRRDASTMDRRFQRRNGPTVFVERLIYCIPSKEMICELCSIIRWIN